MPVDIKEYNKYIDKTPYYILGLYRYLINSQKTAVMITSIKVFFNIHVPDNKNIDIFETKIKDIFTNSKDKERKVVNTSKLQIEHVKAFPIQEYHLEKKPYLLIITPITNQRSIVLDIILKYNLEIEKVKQRHKLAKGGIFNSLSNINKYELEIVSNNTEYIIEKLSENIEYYFLDGLY